jgi:hypothetical protein
MIIMWYGADDRRKRIRGEECDMIIMWYAADDRRKRIVKREGRTLFLLPKVKVEFRHLFSLQKRFSLCFYHNINANIVVFC